MGQRTFGSTKRGDGHEPVQADAAERAGLTPELPQLAGNQAVLHLLGVARVQRAPRDGNAAAGPEEREADQAATAVAANGSGGQVVTSSGAGGGADQQPAAGALLAEDDAATLSPGQMRKSDFITQLRGEVCASADIGLAAGGMDSQGCPWIDYWFSYYAGRDAVSSERALRRFAPEAASASTARDYIAIVVARVQTGVDRYVKSGELPPMPEDMRGGPAEGAAGNVSFKAREGGAHSWDNPPALLRKLGKGRPLDAGVRARMESSFGTGFGRVRLHTDSTGGSLSDRMNARAFAVGDHIAFSPGEYRPGTPEGDALIAHELAHVVQQGRTSRDDAASESALEDDAMRAAAGVLLGRASSAGLTSRLSSGLSLRRCSKNDPNNPELLRAFADKFSDAANLIRQNPEALRLVVEAAAAGVQFGGYAEDGPAHNAYPYTSGNTVYVPRARTDPVMAMNGFLFELNNALRAPRFAAITAEATGGTIDARQYAYKVVEQEVEGMLRLGEIWFEMKRRHGGTDWDQYDGWYYRAEYDDFRAGRKTKDDIIRDTLRRTYTAGSSTGMTVEQYYMQQYQTLHPAGAGSAGSGAGSAGSGAGSAGSGAGSAGSGAGSGRH